MTVCAYSFEGVISDNEWRDAAGRDGNQFTSPWKLVKYGSGANAELVCCLLRSDVERTFGDTGLNLATLMR